jgi:molybdopterin synthase sulfur carrier subunit
MGVTVRIPGILRRHTGGEANVAVTGTNVKEAIQSLVESFPNLKDRLLEENGDVRSFINIYLNDEDIRFKGNLETDVKDGDRITLLPAIAGGAQVTRKVYLTFPRQLIKEPVIYQVGHKFRVVTNIRTASVTQEIGLVALEIQGDEEEYHKAVKYLKEVGVTVEPIEKDVIE